MPRSYLGPGNTKLKNAGSVWKEIHSQGRQTHTHKNSKQESFGVSRLMVRWKPSSPMGACGRVWVNYSDWEKKIVTFELVQERIEGII